MIKFEVKLSAEFDVDYLIAKLKTAVAQLSLTIGSEGSLKTIPGSIHWHITKQNCKGTLEATFEKTRFRLWLSYHDNRHAEWMDDAIEKIKLALES